MARKFLYFIAVCIAIFIAGRLALTFYPDTLSRLAFKPSGQFESQSALSSAQYAEPGMWLVSPNSRNNPARWAPKGPPAPTPVRVAVFFVHPTSYLAKAHWNAPLGDNEARTRAVTFIRAMASPFAGAEQIWAPRYRQAAFGAFLTQGEDRAKALDLAYGDVLQAFDHFVSQIPADMPIVLAGHSQGALHLRRLMAERVKDQPLGQRIAAAYLVGWPLSLKHDLPQMGLQPCNIAEQPGCVMSWLSYGEPADPAMTIAAYEADKGLDGQSLKGSAFLCSNPLTGSAGGTAPASANLGALVPDDKLENGEIKPAFVPATCRPDGMLSLQSAPEMGDYVLPGNNYHVYDIPLFWMNVRADFTRRVAAWQAAR